MFIRAKKACKNNTIFYAKNTKWFFQKAYKLGLNIIIHWIHIQNVINSSLSKGFKALKEIIEHSNTTILPHENHYIRACHFDAREKVLLS